MFNEGEEATYWLDNVDCNGTEDNLFACQSSGKGNHNCGRHHRAGVNCTGMYSYKPASQCQSRGLVTMAIFPAERKFCFSFAPVPYYVSIRVTSD